MLAGLVVRSLVREPDQVNAPRRNDPATVPIARQKTCSPVRLGHITARPAAVFQVAGLKACERQTGWRRGSPPLSPTLSHIIKGLIEYKLQAPTSMPILSARMMLGHRQ